MFKAKGFKAIENAVSGINKAVATLEEVQLSELEASGDCDSKIDELLTESGVHKLAAQQAKSIAAKLKELVA